MKKRKPKPIESHIIPESQSVKWPNLERDSYAIFFSILGIITAIAVYIGVHYR